MSIETLALSKLFTTSTRRAIKLIALFFCITLSASGQHHKLLNLSEKQIRKKVNNYKYVIRDSSEHEFIPYLTFGNKKNEAELVIAFFGSKCYMIKHFSSKESFDSASKSADKLYDKIGDNFWRDKGKTFEVRIFKTPDKIVTIYNRGVSN